MNNKELNTLITYIFSVWFLYDSKNLKTDSSNKEIIYNNRILGNYFPYDFTLVSKSRKRIAEVQGQNSHKKLKVFCYAYPEDLNQGVLK